MSTGSNISSIDEILRVFLISECGIV